MNVRKSLPYQGIARKALEKEKSASLLQLVADTQAEFDAESNARRKTRNKRKAKSRKLRGK